jgi:predicted ferric reductase
MFSINKGYSYKFHQVLSLLAVVLMMLAVSVRRDGKWLGHQLKSQPTAVAMAAATLCAHCPTAVW